MGAPMARRLHDGGYPLTVWNRTAQRADALLAAGAKRARTAADAVQDARIVILMVADPAAVQSVLVEQGVAGAMPAESLLIDCSTVGPVQSRRSAAILADAGKGVRFVEAPVLGSTPAAKSGTLTVLAGGEAGALDEAEPVLRCFGTVLRIGDVGSANALKLVMNLLFAGVTELLAEALVLAERSGLTRDLVRETLFSSALRSPFLEYKSPQLFERRFEPLFTTELMVKDLDLALAQARDVGASLPATRTVRETYAQTVVADGPPRDYSSVIETIERATAPS